MFTCNTNTWEAEVGGVPQVQDQLDIHSEFQASQDHITRLFQKERRKRERGEEGRKEKKRKGKQRKQCLSCLNTNSITWVLGVELRSLGLQGKWFIG